MRCNANKPKPSAANPKTRIGVQAEHIANKPNSSGDAAPFALRVSKLIAESVYPLIFGVRISGCERAHRIKAPLAK